MTRRAGDGVLLRGRQARVDLEGNDAVGPPELAERDDDRALERRVSWLDGLARQGVEPGDVRAFDQRPPALHLLDRAEHDVAFEDRLTVDNAVYDGPGVERLAQHVALARLAIGDVLIRASARIRLTLVVGAHNQTSPGWRRRQSRPGDVSAASGRSLFVGTT